MTAVGSVSVSADSAVQSVCVALKDSAVCKHETPISINVSFELSFPLSTVSLLSVSFGSRRCMETSSIAALLRIKSLEKVKAWATCGT